MWSTLSLTQRKGRLVHILMPAKPISILIPTRNYDCRPLVETLRRQLLQAHVEGEIILGDDSSDPRYAQLYDSLQQEGLIRLVRPTAHLGAGRMRNYLAQQAEGDQLLIIDSDTMPASDSFVVDYLQAAHPDRVVVGGFRYPTERPTSDRLLRYKYGHKVETRSLAERQQAPADAFVSMSFLIPRHIFLEEGFPAEMGMGYEDAYFGYRLAERGVAITHIDNPVIHALKETSDQFLDTTERYVENLYRHRALLAPYPIRLLQLYLRLERARLVPLLGSLAPFLKPLLRRQLTSGHPSLRLFALYKLLHLCSLRS